MIVLDAGALIAIDRGDRNLTAALRREHQLGRAPCTHGAIVGQAWRSGARQARLAQFLAYVEVRPIDQDLGRRAGSLLARTGGADVIDAALVLLCRDGDLVVTSDPDDIVVLAEAAHLRLDVVRP